jgi:hypothetical protein
LRPAAPLAALADRTFRSLRRHRNYRLYFAGSGISLVVRGRAASLYFFAFMGGGPLGGLVAESLTAHGGTRLAFAFAGAMALLVAATGAAVLLTGRRPAVVPPPTLEVQA